MVTDLFKGEPPDKNININEIIDSYTIKFFHELLTKDGYLEKWQLFKEQTIYEARFVESTNEKLKQDRHILESIQEIEVLEAFVKVLAFQVYEENISDIRYELKKNDLKKYQQEVTMKTVVLEKENNDNEESVYLSAKPPPVPPPLPIINSTGGSFYQPETEHLIQSIQSSQVKGTAVPPPPPPLPGLSFKDGIFGSCPRAVPPKKKSVQAVSKLKINTIHQASSNSIWSSVNADILKEAENWIPIEEFENLFCVSVEEKRENCRRNRERSKSLTLSVGGPTAVICLLDTKRSTNISISLSRFKNFSDIQHTFERIKSADPTISEDLLTALIKCEPTSEEIEILKTFIGTGSGDVDVETLNTPEKFVLEFSKHANISWMIRALRHKIKMPTWGVELEEGIKLFKDTFWTLQHSRTVLMLMMCLRRLFELNNVVYGDQRAVQGISISGIFEFSKIQSIVKEKDNKKEEKDDPISMIEYMELRMPGVGDRLKDSLKDIEKAVQTDWDSLSADLADLKIADRFFFQQKPPETEEAFLSNVTDFFEEWHEKIQKLDAEFTECRSMWLAVCDYFQEDPEGIKPTELLRIWVDLIDLLQKAQSNRLSSQS